MATKPPYAPNVVNQTVSYGGTTWKGNPGTDWTIESSTGSSPSSPSSGSSVDTSGITAALAKGAANQSDFLARFRAAIAGTPATGGTAAVPGMAERIQTELGIPALAQAAGDVATNVTNMPYTQGAATRGYDVNADQLQRIINQKQTELAPTATALANQLQAVTPLATQRIAQETLPWTTEASMVSETAAREVTGYTDIMQANLNVLLEKMREGAAITAAEVAQANALALKEQEFEQAKQATQITEAGGRKLLINSQTGQVIKDLGSTTSGTGGSGIITPAPYKVTPTSTFKASSW